ncbi:MAG: ATP-dependent metallopeptidase FtsH/Yme1/Tma family protein, partial [Gemmatimonadetes bacterium]|nr:ATP-dependent metallopeptidase FtsH/Yme1/Tma family protein [Gemmatimonadota bacterium]
MSRGPSGPLDDRKNRFSVGFLVLAFLALFAVHALLGSQGTKEIPYSKLKDEIRAGRVESV